MSDGRIHVLYLASSQSVSRIVAALRELATLSPFVATHTVSLRGNYSVRGKPVRIDEGDVRPRLDDAGRRNLNRLERMAVAGLTWPLLVRYGYVRE